jgi:hypothetical protein
MAANTLQTAETTIIPSTDPAIQRAFGNNIQATVPTFAIDPNIFIINQISQGTVTNLLGGGQANGAEGGVQYNSNNVLSSNTNFRYDTAANSLIINGLIITGAINTDYIRHANGEPWVFGSGNGSVGGGNLSVQFNNAGNFGGISGSSYNPFTGAFTLGNIGNIKIGGGTSGQVLITDGASNLSFSSIVPNPAGATTEIQFNDAGSLAGNTELTFVKASINLALAGTGMIKTTFLVLQ